MTALRSTVLAAALGALLAGCAVGPDYSRPALDVPGAFPDPLDANGAAAPQAGAAIAAQWWTLYGDSTLDELVATALQRNADARLAAARIEEANASLREAGAAFLPEIDGGLSGSRARVSAGTAFPNPPPLIRNDVRLALSTSFELDFWGRLRRAREAVRAQELGSRYGREVVALTLEGLVTQAYFSLRSLDTQVELTRRTLATRQDSLSVVRARSAAGLVSDLDVNLAIGSVADAQVQLKDLQRQRALVEHQLATLTGRLDQRIAARDTNAGSTGAAGLPDVPALPVPGLPSALLERRPDVRQAELALVSANAQVGVAKAAYFPTISLTGFNGGESTALASVLENSGRIWSVGLNAAGPLLDWGRTSARVSAAEARTAQAVAGYQRAVETAFREVADAITSLREATDVQQDLQDRAAAARNSVELVGIRYRSGYSAYIEVLDAQRTANDAELALARNRLALLNASVDLMRALGGGWSEPDLARPTQSSR